MPVRLCNSRSIARSSSCSVAGSSRDEASSRITSAGSLRKTRAKANSCASPADRLEPPASSCVSKPFGNVRYQLNNPSSSSASRMRASSMLRLKKVRLSRTLAANNCTSCVTIPTRWRKLLRLTSRTSTSPMRIAPTAGSYRRNSKRVIVVLPLPVRPSRPNTRPSGRSNDTSSITTPLFCPPSS